jgi:hypothetical protein
MEQGWNPNDEKNHTAKNDARQKAAATFFQQSQMDKGKRTVRFHIQVVLGCSSRRRGRLEVLFYKAGAMPPLLVKSVISFASISEVLPLIQIVVTSKSDHASEIWSTIGPVRQNRQVTVG